MARMEFTDSDEVFDSLTKTIGRMAIETTGWKVVSTDEEVIPKVEGPFILIDLSDAEQINWRTNETLIDGKYVAVHNYVVTYTLTAYRGKPQVALSRLLQGMGLPFIYDKYFPRGSPWAFSSSSSISRMRVPLNLQDYERRARVQLLFNVAFVEMDNDAFEDVEIINIGLGIQQLGDDTVIEVPATIDKNNPPNTPQSCQETPLQ